MPMDSKVLPGYLNESSAHELDRFFIEYVVEIYRVSKRVLDVSFQPLHVDSVKVVAIHRYKYLVFEGDR